MKKHLIRVLALVCGLTLFSSCMKNDPAKNDTVYYGYQQIPNINEFMPRPLLDAMDIQINNQDTLHGLLNYGDEPPRIEGIFVANDIVKTNVICVPGSTWIHQLNPTGGITGTRVFEFQEQHKGIAKLHYLFHNNGTPVEESFTDTTYAKMKNHLDDFIADSISPIYFKTQRPSVDQVFNTIYIIGNAPKFTIFFYEARRPRGHAQDFDPIYANIITGEVDKEEVTHIVVDTVHHTSDTIVEVKSVIKNFKWGTEAMSYYKNLNTLNTLLNMSPALYPRKGEIMIVKNDGSLHQVEQLD